MIVSEVNHVITMHESIIYEEARKQERIENNDGYDEAKAKPLRG